jgi:hypothetical protein
VPRAVRTATWTRIHAAFVDSTFQPACTSMLQVALDIDEVRAGFEHGGSTRHAWGAGGSRTSGGVSDIAEGLVHHRHLPGRRPRSDQSARLNRRQTTPGAAGPGDIEQTPHFRPTHRPPSFGALANSVTAHSESHVVGNPENRADTAAIDPLYLFDRPCGPVWKGRLSRE